MVRIIFLFAVVFFNCGVALGQDGEGLATMAAKTLVAGSQTTIPVAFTVGSSGIAVGGGVALCFHHASDWPVQVVAPKVSGYVAVEGLAPADYELTEFMVLPDSMLTAPSYDDNLFHHCLKLTIKNHALAAAAGLKFILGANLTKIEVHHETDRNHEFRVLTDVDGDGVYKKIAQSPHFDIIAGTARRLIAVLPSNLVLGKPFQLNIRAEDEFYNVDPNYSGTVDVLSRSGALVFGKLPVTQGNSTFTLSFDKLGPHLFKLSDGRLSGRSNPFWSNKYPQPMQVFWGDIHGHTAISDGLADNLDDYFTFARDTAHLDVSAVTDHGYRDWPATQQAVSKYHDPNRFVTILGFEGGALTSHMNYYYLNDGSEHINKWTTDFKTIFDIIYGQYFLEKQDLIIGPHHISYRRPVAEPLYPFGLFDEKIERFVEIYSKHGASEYYGNPRPLSDVTEAEKDKFVQPALAKGLKFGIIGSGDSHTGHPGHSVGRYPGGLVAFVAKDLTRASIWDAFWNYRVYATSFERIYLTFTVNKKEMGSSITAPPPYQISYTVNTQTDGAEVYLIRNNQEIRKHVLTAGTMSANFSDTPITVNNFYYLRVVQSNGEQAWSTPIWLSY